MADNEAARDMKRILVYETLSGGGALSEAGDPDELAELAAQGRAMRDAIVADLGHLPGLQISYAAAAGSAAAPPAGIAPLRCLQLASTESPADFLLRQRADHDLVWVVAPETGGLLGAPAARASMPAAGSAATPRRSALASSKSATLAALDARAASPRRWHSPPTRRAGSSSPTTAPVRSIPGSSARPGRRARPSPRQRSGR